MVSNAVSTPLPGNGGIDFLDNAPATSDADLLGNLTPLSLPRWSTQSPENHLLQQDLRSDASEQIHDHCPISMISSHLVFCLQVIHGALLWMAPMLQLHQGVET